MYNFAGIGYLQILFNIPQTPPTMSQIKKILFLGSGTSGSLPNITCLTKTNDCVCKNYFIDKNHPDVRNNTSILVMLNDGNEDRNILIDCGKTFRQSALQFFPIHNIKKIDAVLLTHGHADAIFGLDDLREFSISNSIPIYCSSGTLDVVKSAFPYLVDLSKATGGGDVAKLLFKVVTYESDDAKLQDTIDDLPFIDLFGLRIDFVPTHHGINPDGSDLFCYGFRFDKLFAYVSDSVNLTPRSTHHLKNTKVLVLDALKEEPHKSHFSIHQAIEEFKKLNIGLGLFVGFCHKLGHEQTRNLVAKTNPKVQNVNNGRICLLENESFNLFSSYHDELVDFDRHYIKYNIKINESITSPVSSHYYAPAYDGLMLSFE